VNVELHTLITTPCNGHKYLFARPFPLSRSLLSTRCDPAITEITLIPKNNHHKLFKFISIKFLGRSIPGKFRISQHDHH
jgi:hypothetical protein